MAKSFMSRIMEFFALTDNMQDEVPLGEDPGVRGGRHVDVVTPNFSGEAGRSPLEVLGARGPVQQVPGAQVPGAEQRPGAYQIVPGEARGVGPDGGGRGTSGVRRVASTGSQPKRTGSSCGNDVRVIKPEEFKDASKVADCLLDDQPVIVNLEAADKELTRRMIDFCAGVAYALQGTMEKVAEQVFLLRPPGGGLSAHRNGAVSGR